MPKFTFRLATLQRLREAACDERRVELAEACRVDDVLRERLDRLSGEIDRIRDDCRRAAAPGEVEVDRLVEAERYEQSLMSQHAQLVQQRETMAAEIQRRRQALLDAHRDVRALEKLRDRQADQFRQEEDRREAKRLDEAAQLQAMRKQVVADLSVVEH
jgi:flagellar protein FliJ